MENKKKMPSNGLTTPRKWTWKEFIASRIGKYEIACYELALADAYIKKLSRRQHRRRQRR